MHEAVTCRRSWAPVVAKQDLRFELFYGGAWHEIKAYTRDPITITRGKTDEVSEPVPAGAAPTLDNKDGELNPSNPRSSLFGLIGRNTAMRMRMVGDHNYGDGYLDLRDGTSRAETADAAALDIVGDIDIRVDAALMDWWTVGLAAKYLTTGNQRSWGLWTDNLGGLTFAWSPLGTAASVIQKTSTASLPFSIGRRFAVRVTLDVDNGAAGNTVTFYYADTIDGPWTQLGNAVVTAGVTSIFSSSAAVEVGDASQVSTLFDDPNGRVYAFQLYSGIAGTLVADADFTTVTDTSFVDSVGRTWTQVGGALFVPASIRMCGETAVWKPRQTIDFDAVAERGDAWVETNVSGILRRLGQGEELLRSALTRSILLGNPATKNNPRIPIAYWPLEDDTGADRPASIIPGTSPMQLTSAVEFGTETSAPGSAPLARLVAANTMLVGEVAVGAYPTAWVNTDGTMMTWLFQIGSETAGSAIMSTETEDTQGFTWATSVALSGSTNFAITLKRWTTGDLSTSVTIDSTTTAIPASPYHMLHLILTQSGANISAMLWWSEPNGPVLSGTVAAATLGKIKRVRFNADAALNGLLLGHVAVHATSSVDVSDIFTTSRGFAGETDAARIARLCLEEKIPFVLLGDATVGVPMGVQPVEKLTEILAETERTGDGLLFDQRNGLGLAYRPAQSMYNQTPALELDYTQIGPPLTYDIDDLGTRNDVTVKRRDGGTERVVQLTGPMNIELPADDPEGVGRVSTQIDINPVSDSALLDHAGWHLRKGTITEPRFSQVMVDLDADPTLADSVSRVDCGDLITIENVPDMPDLVRLIVVGMSEPIGGDRRMIAFNCKPASPFDIGVLDSATYLGSDGSTTNASFIAGGATSLSVAVADGYPLWVTGAVSLDILVFGVRLHVTNIAGAASPQTFTVDQTPVNGVTKTIPAGKRVDLFQPRYVGM